MKTTVKLGAGRAIVVTPQQEGVRVDLTLAGVAVGGDVLTGAQVGALLFGLEQAAEAVQLGKQRRAAQAAA
jgi:hypothetical protein